MIRFAKSAIGECAEPRCGSFPFPWIGFGFTTCLEVGADAQDSPFLVSFDPGDVGLLGNTSGVAANVIVSVGTTSLASQSIPAGTEAFTTFPQGTIGGPVMVNSDQTLLVSQRVQYYQSFNEVWAETAAQAATTSYFQWFDHVSSPGFTNDNIHVLNPGTTTATVTVTLGASHQTLTVAAGAETYTSFPGMIGGPVTVSSTIPVLASQRVQYFNSFNEVWAEAASQATAVSYFNWFDKASVGMLNDNIHVFNPGVTTANVTVSLPSGTAQVQNVAAGTEVFFSLPAGNIGGPLTVTVNSGPPVLASQRVQYFQSFNEVWSESAAQASTTLHFTWYDKVSSPGFTNDNIHLLNPGATSATVQVALPGATTQTVTVAAGTEAFVSFPGKIGGPVTITSTVAILSSQRVQFFQSFNEIWAS